MSDHAPLAAHSTVVFTGPSVSPTHASNLLQNVDVRPPARRGDLYDARERGTGLIVLIDGIFAHRLAVPPSEIVGVLQDGARVIGSSSLGAIRAAECWPAGMRGVGLIYRLYRIGAISSDDEVAVTLDADADYALASVALINVRFAARRAHRHGMLDAACALRLVDAAQDEHFSRRTWPSILTAAGVGNNPELRALCQRTDVKRDDAIDALQQAASEARHIPLLATPRSVPRRERYPGHLLTFGLDEAELRLELLRWLFGSGRYQRYIWSLMIGEPEFASLDSGGSRPEALREGLAAALARLIDDPCKLSARLWEELDFLDELDAELERWNAHRPAPTGHGLPRSRSDAHDPHRLLRTREKVAIGHGYPSWNSLVEDVSSGRLFEAIPLAWINKAVQRLAASL